jgi:D-arabinose 1-dehydrogenase-like Zn-dependent alcohol dehydrogenase
VNWGIEDLAAAATLFCAGGIAVAVILMSVRERSTQLLLMGGVGFVSLAIWAHLAVGFF